MNNFDFENWIDKAPCYWNDWSLLLLMSAFINKEGLSDKLNDFLQKCEEEESLEYKSDDGE